MRSVKDALGLDVLGIYRISCICGSSYIGQMGRSIAICRKEHQCCLHLGHLEQLALMQHSWDTGHKTLFDDTTFVCSISSYSNRVIRKSLKIKLTESMLNKEDGAQSSNMWLPGLEPLMYKECSCFVWALRHDGRQAYDSARVRHMSNWFGLCLVWNPEVLFNKWNTN